MVDDMPGLNHGLEPWITVLYVGSAHLTLTMMFVRIDRSAQCRNSGRKEWENV